ncbi:hypothetical protein NP233_g2122 [Leucocoprinus birnbaumii]|uniref:Uncharacterized protein n=1 Tax=Leucocoprinus birnbaumii TaxID=56174 RepID=A0AAD5VYU0_9AGAR|nr:hypothetical protein NP233_g2122 [Leucocoprinus birnbaumii]
MPRLPHSGPPSIANHPPILNVDLRRDLPAPVAISDLQLYFPYPPTPPPSLADEETWLLASSALRGARHGGQSFLSSWRRLKTLIRALLCCGCMEGQHDVRGHSAAQGNARWRALHDGGRDSYEPLLTAADERVECDSIEVNGSEGSRRAVVTVEDGSESSRSSFELDIVDILGPKLPPIEIFVHTHTQIHYQESSYYLH